MKILNAIAAVLGFFAAIGALVVLVVVAIKKLTEKKPTRGGAE